LEAATVAAAFGENGRVLPREKTTPEGVLAALRTADVALLSCHAFADLAAPLESGFLLRGVEADHPERDAILRLRDLLNEDLQLRLAVLSACETSLPGTDLPDEVVALPTGLLQAGVGGVLATLWPVDDQPTCRLVLEFFRRMQYENQAPAVALQGAQQWLRDTTSIEKISFYEDAEANAPWLVEEAAEALLEDLYWQEDDERSDAGLNSWAAFMHVGA
jgi:CHAT domain-containing protein